MKTCSKWTGRHAISLKMTQKASQTPSKTLTKLIPAHCIAQAAETLRKPVENQSFAGALGEQLTQPQRVPGGWQMGMLSYLYKTTHRGDSDLHDFV